MDPLERLRCWGRYFQDGDPIEVGQCSLAQLVRDIETERARRDAETRKLRGEVAELRAKNDIRFSLTRTAAVNTKLRAQIADLEAQLKAAKERAPDESAAVTEATATIEGLRENVERMKTVLAEVRKSEALHEAQAATARERFEGLRGALEAEVDSFALQEMTERFIRSTLDKFPPLPEPGEGERVVWRDAPRDNKAPERGYYWVKRDDPEPDLHFYSEGQDFGMLVYRVAGPLTIPEPVDPETTESES